MKPFRIRSLIRATFAALAILLTGCDDGPTTPESLTGNWLAVAAYPNGSRVEDRLELTSDGRFVWTTVAFGAGGRTQDGMGSWFSRSGDWGVEGDRLALRTMSAMAWEEGHGWSQLEYMPEWNRQHRLRLEGERLVLSEILRPEQSSLPRTYRFEHIEGPLDVPRP